MSDDEEGQLFEESDDEPVVQKKRKAPSSGSSSKVKKSKPDRSSLIDDAAELSGNEDDDDDEEEEEDDENENDYIKDGFVVDEDEEVEVRKKGDLEDSDEDDDDEDDEGRLRKKKGRVRKMRDLQRLDDDDLDLINEARGIVKPRDNEALTMEREAEEIRIRAQNEAELRKGLFYRGPGDMEEDDELAAKQRKKKERVERYDEDGMSEFIEDDIGDQGDIIASDNHEFGGTGGISEAQLHEANEIFGSDYLEYMQEEEGQEEEDGFMGGSKYRERGVGVDYGVDSEGAESDEDDDDDDLFGDDDDGATPSQKAEALRLKREKRKQSKAERRRQAKLKKAQRQKAELRKNFEPVQLIENFCTEKDDEIRMKDAPERFYDWNTPFHGPTDGSAEIGDEEDEEAMWIVSRIPEIKAAFATPPPMMNNNGSLEEAIKAHQDAILKSIVYALRFMHQDMLEPPFIQRYRADIVTSQAVRENLYAVMDHDDEWDRLIVKRNAAEDLLGSISAASNADEAQGDEETNIQRLTSELEAAQADLDGSLEQERSLKAQLSALGDGGDDDDDDDDLFGEVRYIGCLFTFRNYD